MINPARLDLNRTQDVIHISSKIAQLALAALGFLTLQLHMPLILSLKITAAICVITFSSEMILTRHAGWFNPLTLNPKIFTCLSFAYNFVTVVKMLYLFEAFKSLGLFQSIKKIFTHDPRALFVSCVVAPIFEEVLFRGFLQERLEDVVLFITRNLNPALSRYAMIVQAVVFGALHNVCYAPQDLSSHFFLFFDTSYLACITTELKKENHGLILPIAYHSLWNFIAHTRHVA